MTKFIYTLSLSAETNYRDLCGKSNEAHIFIFLAIARRERVTKAWVQLMLTFELIN